MTQEEEMALRELAAKPHYIARVQELLGPLSLWSSQRLQDHVRKAVLEEREACAKILDANAMACESPIWRSLLQSNAQAIRARGQA
jgi:hypothetical protein